MTYNLLAIDIGASSGRAMLGTYAGGRLSLSELHRFANEPVEMTGRLYWDLPRLFRGVKRGLSAAALEGIELNCIGIDTWGADYALLDKSGRVMGNPVHYRDGRTDMVMEAVFGLVPKQEIYQRTGLAFLQLNSLYQLYSDVQQEDPLLAHARQLLFMPDLFAYLLTGTAGCEYTIASTSQMINPHAKDWDMELLERLNIPTRILLPISEPGKVRGMLDGKISRETGVGVIPVVAVGGHDTASAVAAVPAADDDFAYISSGTWSLVGVETKQPVISPEAQRANLTNEGGVNGSFRVLKNVMGMWIIEECRREWERKGRTVGYDELLEQVEQAEPFASFIDPNDPIFSPMGDMTERIQRFCMRTGQEVPKTIGQIARCVYESLAMKYRWTVERLRETTGKRIPVLHVVGGGSNNGLLNRFTADALGIPVLAGPSEATAIGNMLMQLQALGLIQTMQEGRQLVRDSFPVQEIQPDAGQTSRWDEVYPRFLAISGE